MSCGATTEKSNIPEKGYIPEKVDVPFHPRDYICYYADEEIIIDGRIDERTWQMAPATETFVDIEGEKKAKPTYDTHARMLWDEHYLYVYAWMYEPHVNGSLRLRDTVVYYDNDFEVFIDPNSDGHEYYEFEINALGTVWDLLLNRPYRDNNGAMDHWSARGLKSAVYVDGTLNDARDTDKGWAVEMAIPWDALAEVAYMKTPPQDGNQWRINFSRVRWQYETKGKNYIKSINPETGKHYAENNWVWSPQGMIAMHRPETWGIVQFSESGPGEEDVDFIANPYYEASWVLYNIYYQQKAYKKQNGYYALNFSTLEIPQKEAPGYQWPPQVINTFSGFEARLKGLGENPDLIINEEGRIFKR
jgi:hypothetical protein